MRPINLIPEEERRSHGTTTRTGPLAYIIVGSLAALLIGVVMLVLASNQISEREDEVASLEVQKAAAVARADRLAPYATFQQVTEGRTQAITSLADSRFDWQRVIRELSLILPPRVFFTSLTGSAGGDGSAGVAGPSLTISGCATGQDTVAGFVASLKDIDGVTRVGLNKSVLGEGGEGGSGAGPCAVGNKAQFEIVVAFDAAPPSPDGPEAAEALALEGEAESGSAKGEGESSTAESSTESETEPEAESSSGETASSSTASGAG